jgi:rubrerythrin
MTLKGSRTEKNLQKAFFNELNACARYRYGASAAHDAGNEQLADILFV